MKMEGIHCGASQMRNIYHTTSLLRDHLPSWISGSEHFLLGTFTQPRLLSRSFDSVGSGAGGEK